MKRLYSILSVVALTVLALGAFGAVRGRAAGTGLEWSSIFARVFSSRTATTLAPAAVTLTVNSTADTDDVTPGDDICLTAGAVCTLRAAITEANADADADTINFAIPTALDANCVVGTGVCTISPASALPTISQPVTIDGYTQPTSIQNTSAVGNNADINIELNGTGAGALVDGLNITAGNCTVRGLAIYRFAGDGIELSTAGGNTIDGNFIGTNATGAGTTNGNAREGVNINNVGTNTIGGSTPEARNIISDNDISGVNISGSSATGNFVQGNYIGTDRTGTLDVGNTVDGVFVGGPSNVIGGATTTPGQNAGNVISGNGPGTLTGSGVRIAANTTTVTGNLIGLTADGTASLGNSNNGVYITTAATNTIGGTSSNVRNVISSNSGAGVAINGAGATGNVVQGNYIGTDVTGTLDRGNTTDGVLIDGGAATNTIGGSAATPGTAPGNVISGNGSIGTASDGVEINGASTNKIQGNLIGTNAAGTGALLNNGKGVFITSNADSNEVGGATSTPGTGLGNVISGNNSDGIEINSSTSSGNLVQGNLVGLQAGGTATLKNGSNGVIIRDSPSNTIGGVTDDLRNVITGGTATTDDGVEINGDPAENNVVAGNYIGTDINGTGINGGTCAAPAATDFGACGDGVRIAGSADNNTVGGSAASPGTAPGNIIAGNNSDGVEITGSGTSSNFVQGNLVGAQANGTTAYANGGNGVNISVNSNTVGGTASGLANTIVFNGGDGVFVSAGTGNSIRANSISSNSGLGIDLGPDGVTPNDAQDLDSGANTLQNFPIITSANSNTQVITGRLNSTPGQTFTIDFYKNQTCDGTNGEGETYLGSVTTGTTDSNGDVTFSFTVSPPAFTATDVITATATNSTNNTSEFSACAVATAVRLKSFAALNYADGVELNWESGFEVNNLGYHIYREQNGKRFRVTPSIVAGSALTVGPGSRLSAGYSYVWFDPQGTADSDYSLEAIDLDGSSEWIGPVTPFVRPSTGRERKASRSERAMLLSEIGRDRRGENVSSVTNWPAAIKTSTAAKSSNTNSLTYSSAEPLQIQQSIAAGKAVKIHVRKSGWYRVTQAELVAAGLDPSSDARMLQLLVDGEEVPITLSTDGARLGSNDTLEFYGEPLDTPTTDTRVYWLISGSSSGKRMIARRGKLKPVGNSELVPGSFDMTVERKEKLVYFSNLLNGDAENIFGSPVRTDPINQTLPIRNLDLESVTQPRLEVALQGLTAGDHQVQVKLNGTTVGTASYAHREHVVLTFPVSPSLLREGDNVVSLASLNGQSDISLLDWVRLTYPHQHKADSNMLRLSVLGGEAVRIDGFSAPTIRVMDVTDPNAPTQLPGLINRSGDNYSVKVQTTDRGVRTLLALTEDLLAQPASITANQPSDWNATTNGADMVIVTHNDFRQAIEPLVTLRRNQGLNVAVVDVEDIFDEFSYGAHTPVAIKSFLLAAANWNRKPAYLLLVGDSSWDPRRYLNGTEIDFVPTKLIDTQSMETASDDWFADFNGSGVANMAIGRLPAGSAAEANLMVSKIMTYEQERALNAPPRGAVMVADSGFEEQSTQTFGLLPFNIAVKVINRAEVGNDDIMRGQIVDALNQGPMIVNYYGHGSVRVWTGSGLLNSDSATNLTNNNRLSLFVMMTCLNGYASDANIDSLGETTLKAPNGGAVAVWASSGFTTPQPQFEMNKEFYRLLFGGQPMRLGDAIRSAKAATSDMDVRRTWILLGDPAMRIR